MEVHVWVMGLIFNGVEKEKNCHNWQTFESREKLANI